MKASHSLCVVSVSLDLTRSAGPVISESSQTTRMTNKTNRVIKLQSMIKLVRVAKLERVIEMQSVVELKRDNY